MNPSGLNFYKYAWDPVIGCKHGCNYCYAKRKFKDNFEPRIYEKRLREPFELKKSAKIFVGHYTDLMGEWVPQEWIHKILGTIRQLPQHTFIFITKNPVRYYEYVFPDNCMLGVTVETPAKWWRAEMMDNIDRRKMCSVEPILGDFTGYDFSQFELVVVGALVTFDDKEPFRGFYETVKHKNIFFTR